MIERKSKYMYELIKKIKGLVIITTVVGLLISMYACYWGDE